MSLDDIIDKYSEPEPKQKERKSLLDAYNELVFKPGLIKDLYATGGIIEANSESLNKAMGITL